MICAWVGVLDTPPGTVRRQPFDVSFSFHHGVLGSRPACQLCTGSAFLQGPSSQALSLNGIILVNANTWPAHWNIPHYKRAAMGSPQ